MINGCILEMHEFSMKSHLSNTHFPDIVNHLSIRKFEFDWCLININAEVFKKEVRNVQILPTLSKPSKSIRIALMISSIKLSYLLVEDLRILYNKQNLLRKNYLLNTIGSLEKKWFSWTRLYGKKEKIGSEERKKLKLVFRK